MALTELLLITLLFVSLLELAVRRPGDPTGFSLGIPPAKSPPKPCGTFMPFARAPVPPPLPLPSPPELPLLLRFPAKRNCRYENSETVEGKTR